MWSAAFLLAVAVAAFTYMFAITGQWVSLVFALLLSLPMGDCIWHECSKWYLMRKHNKGTEWEKTAVIDSNDT